MKMKRSITFKVQCAITRIKIVDTSANDNTVSERKIEIQVGLVAGRRNVCSVLNSIYLSKKPHMWNDMCGRYSSAEKSAVKISCPSIFVTEKCTVKAFINTNPSACYKMQYFYLQIYNRKGFLKTLEKIMTFFDRRRFRIESFVASEPETYFDELFEPLERIYDELLEKLCSNATIRTVKKGR